VTQDEIIEMAREAGVLSGYESDLFQRFAKLVAAAEREACAKLAEMAEPYSAADLIRKRGQA
jgi:hypothetical protein